VQLYPDAFAFLVSGRGRGAETCVRGVEEGAAGEVLEVPGYGDDAGDGGGVFDGVDEAFDPADLGGLVCHLVCVWL
jgi:hypothetical protein